MKLLVIGLLTAVLWGCSAQNKTLVVASPVNSEVQWRGNIEAQKEKTNFFTIDNATVKALGKITFHARSILFNDADISGRKIEFSGSVDTITIKGTVNISCRKLIFSGDHSVNIIIKRNNDQAPLDSQPGRIKKITTSPAELTIEYRRRSWLKKERKITLTDLEKFEVIFIKR